MNRFWIDATQKELLNHGDALMELAAVSEAHWKDTVAELEAIRKPLYATDEEGAIKSAGEEEVSRVALFAKTGVPYQPGVPHPGDVEDPKERPREDAKAWVKTLWEETKGEEMWGYAGFFHPELESDEYHAKSDDYNARKGAALQWAKGTVGLGGKLEARFRMRTLEFLPFTDHFNWDFAWIEMIQKLRKKFRAIRELPPRQRDATGMLPKDGGLEAGILRNVFLVEDRQCLELSMRRKGTVDNMWVWAVDPDYDDEMEDVDGDEPDSSNYESNDEYKGYMRVRLQQLVNNFFEARKFRADEYSLKDLWRLGKHSRNSAFVSTDLREILLWSKSRDVGSALRPSPPSTLPVDALGNYGEYGQLLHYVPPLTPRYNF